MRVKMLVVLAVAVAVAASVASGAQATVPRCQFKKNGVVVAFAGSGVDTRYGRAFCAGFASTFQGRRFYGKFGTIRCDFWNERHRMLMAILTRNKLLGYSTCVLMAPFARRMHFIEIDKPKI